MSTNSVLIPYLLPDQFVRFFPTNYFRQTC